jgi:hypothetical protein
VGVHRGRMTQVPTPHHFTLLIYVGLLFLDACRWTWKQSHR